MSDTVPAPCHIASLDLARVLLLLVIFTCHGDMFLPTVVGKYDGGITGYALDLFFMISGFGCMLSALGRPPESTFHYLKRKVATFYPLHMIMYFVSLAILPTYLEQFGLAFDLKDAVAQSIVNLLLLQSWAWTSDYVLSFNGVSWFLSSLVFCYLLAPTLAKRLRRVSPLRAPFYALGLSTMLFAAASWYNSAIGFATLCFTDVFPPYRFSQFAIGGFIAVAYRGIAKTGRIPRSNLIQVGAFALFLVVYFLNNGHIDHPIPDFGFMILETMLLFAACCVDGGLSDVGNTRAVRFLSGCSLPFFLLHARVLQAFRLYVGEPGVPDAATVATFVGLLAVAVAISYAYTAADAAVRRAWRARRAGAAS